LPEPLSPDHAQGLSRAHGQINAIHGFEVPHHPLEQSAATGKPHPQIPGLQDRLTGGHRGRPALGLGIQQQPGIGIRRVVENRVDGALLDNFSLLHHRHPIGDPSNHAQVMTDKQHRHAKAALQVRQQIQDLSLNGDVQRRGGLIGDQQAGTVGDGHGNHHPLTLPPGELMGESPQTTGRLRQPHHLQQLDDAIPGDGRTEPLMNPQGFADLLFNGVQRVQ